MSSTYVEGPTPRPGKHGIRQKGRRGRRSVSTEPSCFRQQPRTTLASILRSSCRCCVRTDAFVTGTSHTPTCPSRICGPTSTTGPTISTADASSQRQLRQAAAEAGSGRLLPTGIAVLPRTTGFGSIVCCGAGRCGSPRRKRQGLQRFDTGSCEECADRPGNGVGDPDGATTMPFTYVSFPSETPKWLPLLPRCSTPHRSLRPSCRESPPEVGYTSCRSRTRLRIAPPEVGLWRLVHTSMLRRYALATL